MPYRFHQLQHPQQQGDRVSDLKAFSSAAKGLARNPLGIIALFIVLIYGFAALTVGINQSLQLEERLPLIWFLVLFPLAVLALFGWLVSKHHEKLYAPADYQTDESFLLGVHVRKRHTAEVQAQQEELKIKLRQTVLDSRNGEQSTEDLADQLSREIDRSTTFTVDARSFLDDEKALFSFPVAAFDSLDDLNNEIYFKIESKVEPFEYGYTWLLRNRDTKQIIRNSRMITGAPPGKPLSDNRSLAEIGISGGTTIDVQRPSEPLRLRTRREFPS
jgi:hypothetical protein